MNCSTQIPKEHQSSKKYIMPKDRNEWAKHVENRKEELISYFIPLLKRFYLSESENFWINEKDSKLRLSGLYQEYFYPGFRLERGTETETLYIVKENAEFQFVTLSSITKTIPHVKNYYHYISFEYPTIAQSDFYGNELPNKGKFAETHIYFTIDDDYKVKIIRLPDMPSMTPRAYIKRLELNRIPITKINNLKKKWNIE